jgi:hypothetical protein
MHLVRMHPKTGTNTNFSIDNQATIKAMQNNRRQPAQYLIERFTGQRRCYVEGDFILISLPPDLLSRTEELRAVMCDACPEFTAPTLPRFTLDLEDDAHPRIVPLDYIPSLLRLFPQLDFLSIRCWTNTNFPPPSLIVSPGVCQSVTWLQIPLMALPGPLASLQTTFTFPNLMLLKFLEEGPDLQSWRNFCLLNGGNIHRLDLYGDDQSCLLDETPDERAFELAEHLHCLACILFLSPSLFLTSSLLKALKENIAANEGKGTRKLLLPNMETCEVYNSVQDPSAMSIAAESLGRWANARNIKRNDEVTGQNGVVRVIWK